jgi:hypothetical protein
MANPFRASKRESLFLVAIPAAGLGPTFHLPGTGRAGILSHSLSATSVPTLPARLTQL